MEYSGRRSSEHLCFLSSFLSTLITMGCSCSIAVERMPLSEMVEGSNPAGCWAFLHIFTHSVGCP